MNPMTQAFAIAALKAKHTKATTVLVRTVLQQKQIPPQSVVSQKEMERES